MAGLPQAGGFTRMSTIPAFASVRDSWRRKKCRRLCDSRIRPSRAANARTSQSGTEAFAFAASVEVSTSRPSRLSSSITGGGTFSLE